jgi:hypothetical protein
MAVVSSQGLMQTHVLTRTNYSFWMSKMRVFLSYHECLDMITTPFTELDDEERDQLNREDRRLYNEM